MAKRNQKGRDRRIRVYGDRRTPADLRKISQAIIELAAAQAEADAKRDHQAPDRRSA